MQVYLVPEGAGEIHHFNCVIGDPLTKISAFTKFVAANKDIIIEVDDITNEDFMIPVLTFTGIDYSVVTALDDCKTPRSFFFAEGDHLLVADEELIKKLIDIGNSMTEPGDDLEDMPPSEDSFDGGGEDADDSAGDRRIR